MRALLTVLHRRRARAELERRRCRDEASEQEMRRRIYQAPRRGVLDIAPINPPIKDAR